MELTENERFFSSLVEKEKETNFTVFRLISIFFLTDKIRNVSM